MSAFSVRRRILSLWLPRLPTDRIRRQRARSGALHDAHRPLISAAKESNAWQITAVNDAAAKLGLEIGLPLANARAVCPDIDVCDADPVADAELLNAIADWCDRFTPLVALDAPHGLFLDITGCAHLFGGEAGLMDQLCATLTKQGFIVSAAIAGTSVCARTLSRHRHGRIVAAGDEARAVKPLPLHPLGADEAIIRGLRRAGLKTIGDVAARGRAEITARFGAAFTALLEAALGQGDSPISPRKPLPDYIVEKRFPEPIATDTVITATLTSLAGMLIAAMDKQGKGARHLQAAFFRTDGVVRVITAQTGQAVNRVEVVDRLFRERLDAIADPLDPGFGFDMIRLSASHTEVVVQQQSDLDSRAQDNDEVIGLVDRLSARIGPRRVFVHLPVDTHIPERAADPMPAQWGLIEASLAPWPLRITGEPPLRPLRLFERPEPIEVALAEFPDKPPKYFTWRRVNHIVRRAEGPERIAMEWWRTQEPQPTRDYFRIEDDIGQRLWIFRDGLYGEILDEEEKRVDPKWFVHGMFA
ncbi:Y-family DNA polymerase [Tardiphaga sp.]|jgi:protein ImuB|uniref:Y-family DNA polymerase n=1 Tax=Tardiphaga sp. TaxID=1926292 RepID=UPI0037D9A4D3